MAKPKRKKEFFQSKLQIFSGIAWIVMAGFHTLMMAGKNFDVVLYLQGLAIITGVCLMAWGMPFSALSANLNLGIPLRPFKLGKPKKKKKQIKAAKDQAE